MNMLKLGTIARLLMVLCAYENAFVESSWSCSVRHTIQAFVLMGLHFILKRDAFLISNFSVKIWFGNAFDLKTSGKDVFLNLWGLHVWPVAE